MRKMKAFGRLTLISVVTLLFVTACDNNKPAPLEKNDLVTAITLEPTSVELTQGMTLQLKATFSPANASNLNEVEWQVRNPNIASVSDSGLATAKEVGQTEIICKVGKVEATCVLTVKEKSLPKDAFEVKLVELNATQVKFSIVPKDKNSYYFCDVIPEETLNCDNMGGIKNVAAKDREWWQMVTGSKNPSDWLKAFAYKGDLEYDSRSSESGSDIACMFWGMKYVLYIYGMDENAMPTTEVMEVPFTTDHKRDSENQIKVEILDTYSKNLHARIKTTNDDPWFFIIESKKYWDSQMNNPLYPELGPKESFAADMLIRNFSNQFLFQKGDFEITPDTQILPPTLRPNRDYVLVVFGFDIAKGSTTEIIATPFKTKSKS